jgi:hypothetical protein
LRRAVLGSIFAGESIGRYFISRLELSGPLSWLLVALKIPDSAKLAALPLTTWKTWQIAQDVLIVRPGAWDESESQEGGRTSREQQDRMSFGA